MADERKEKIGSPEIDDASVESRSIGEDDQGTVEDRRVSHLMSHTIDLPILASAVEQQEAADAADTLEGLEDEDAAEVLEAMDDQFAADALAEMETPLAIGVFNDVLEDDLAYATRLIGLMAPDDAADLLQALDPEAQETVLSAMHLGIALPLRRLIGYHEESAGGLMTTDFVALRADMTIAEATEAIRRQKVPDQMQYLPVCDEQGRLVGLVSLREVLIEAEEDRVGDHMDESVRAVHVNTDRERVAREFDRYDHTLLPVVDNRDHLLGVVTVDDVIDIIRAEQTEDVQMTVGASAVEAVYSGLGEKFRGRFPWLGVSLVMTALAATAVLVFEDLIQRMPILAFIMPVIAALVGNAGHQALAVTLRGIVLDEVRPDRVTPLIVREAMVGLLIGSVLGVFVCGAVTAMSSWIDSASFQIGLIAGISTTTAMTVGTLAGSCVPLVMRRFGIDPAHASAIFLIMITDAVSFTVLLGLTYVLVG